MPERDRLSFPRRRRLMAPAAVTAILVVLIVAAVATVMYVTRDRRVAAPNLLGLSLTEAAVVAERSGVGLIVVDPEDPASMVTSAGPVAVQDPSPGATMRRGGVIAVSLAAPPPEVVVPEVVGVTREEAEARLSKAGLYLGALREDGTAAGTPGTVARQLPAAGALAVPGATVDVWIAGVATVSAPDLTNLTEAEAVAAATAAGLSVRFLPEVTDEVLPGVVFRQSPGTGERVAPGSVMVAVLNAAQGPPVDDEETTETVADPPPPIFVTLSASYRFPVLYPSRLPTGLVMLVGPTNPGHRVGPMGTQGFEVTYTDPARPGVRLSLLEGDWFDPGLDRSTTVDVRGYAATLGAAADATVVVWSENGTMYALSALGLQEQELLSAAQGLLPLPPP